MDQFIVFLGQQWILVGILIASVFLLVKHESNKGGASLSPQQVINVVNQQEGVVVDLRDAADFKAGHVVDAINIPASKLASKVSELESYRNRPIILVCKMGQHSGAAGKTLAAQGFENISRMQGGMMEWQNMQLPLIKA